MSKNLEIEAKSMLEKSEYEIILSKFLKTKIYAQTNYYISSKELAKKVNDIGLRIRKKKNGFELTLKIRNNNENTEINQKIPYFSYIFFKFFNIFPYGEVREFLTVNAICDIKKLRYIGKMKTLRKDICFNGSLISVDKSKYNHKIDYEIECEDSSYESAENNLKIFLNQFEIEYKKSKFTKLARFLNTK